METKTVIFAGPPGSGKGTQSDRLANFFAKQDDDKDLLYFDVGQSLRELADNCSDASAHKIEKQMDTGGILPTFLAVHMWTKVFLSDLNQDTHLIVDGSPRRLREAKLLDEALEFYGRESPVVIHLDIDEEETHDRLKDRGRSDDAHETIKTRLQAYKQETRPILSGWFDVNDRYRYVSVDGQRDRDVIQDQIQDIVTA